MKILFLSENSQVEEKPSQDNPTRPLLRVRENVVKKEKVIWGDLHFVNDWKIKFWAKHLCISLFL